MKTSFIISLLALASFSALAQADPIESFFQQYSLQEEVTNVKLGSLMLNIAAKFVEDEDTAQLTRKLKKLRLLVFPATSEPDANALLALRQAVKAQDFSDLLYVRDGRERVEILVRENAKGITDVLLLVDDEDEFIFLSLQGLLRYEDLRNLNIDVNGEEYLHALPAERPKA